MCLPLLGELGIGATMNPGACKEDHNMTIGAATAGANFYGKRLIFYGAAESKKEPALLQLFSQFGEVTDMFIVRSALGISSGCGHVTFATAEQAKSALQALRGSNECADQGTALGMLLVEEGPSNSPDGDTPGASSTPSTSPKATGSTHSETKCGKAVFFTKVPPTVTSQQLIQLFSACGEVAHLELFIPWPGAKISRGCGLVEFTCSGAAAAAVYSMHQQFTWPHSHSALVVEWVDRSRQSTNSKSHKARAGAATAAAAAAAAAAAGGSGAGPVSSTAGSLPGVPTLRGDQYQAGASSAYHWRPMQPGQQQQQSLLSGSSLPSQQQQLLQFQPIAGVSTRSCPLPQLPPGWHVIGTSSQLPPAVRVAHTGMAPTWASVPSSLSSMTGCRTQQAGGAGLPQPLAVSGAGDAGVLALQQQQQQQLLQQRSGVTVSSEAGGSGGWMACPAASTLSNVSLEMNSLTSLGSVYDATMLSGSTCSSNANSAANSAVLHSRENHHSGGALLDLSGCEATPGNSKGSLGASYGAQQQFSEPMLTTQAGAGIGGSDTILQQLLQQNVMLLQTMTPPREEDTISQQLLLPTSGAIQQQSLQASMVAQSSAAVAGALGGGGLNSFMTTLSPGHHQVPAVPHMLYTGSMLPAAQPQRQQLLWLQPSQAAQPTPQQQQQQQDMAVVVALPLSQRQLSAMSGVLPEVPRLTGAQAWISSAATGGLQLCLSGSFAQLQAGHTAVSMLLSKAGIEEPLARAVVHAAAN